ncbi:hypothetical protein TeGR_g2727 [Tetraparma gracilis]|uniref:Uncharacterized protein n=1 Tax=Tetraparma gracilis TaxID=2962635 RepID=A0ABQ6M766_9STRA|nr:hypothetical protein TeGR_g2727 [Tetraparma gracilis]
MGQSLTTIQFYAHGRRHSTLTGYRKHVASYPAYASSAPQPSAYLPPSHPDLDAADLSGKTVVITGANSGIGYALATYCAGKNASVLMFCRSQERGDKAARTIQEETSCAPGNVRCVQCDVGLKSSIDAAISSLPASLRVDSLVCNAGVLLNERTLTEEGVECTAATHLVYGSYYLTKRLLSSEAARLADDGKVVFLSSGGMYNTKFSWAGCLSLDPDRYSGNLSYAYAKRGQVLLAEELTKAQPEGGKRSFVSAHPGWVDTPAVDLAYGSGKRALQPMRDMWQGAEGIAWLLTAPAGEVESGGFYLDRGVQKKHLNKRTENTPEQVADMLTKLKEQTGI